MTSSREPDFAAADLPGTGEFLLLGIGISTAVTGLLFAAGSLLPVLIGR